MHQYLMAKRPITPNRIAAASRRVHAWPSPGHPGHETTKTLPASLRLSLIW